MLVIVSNPQKKSSDEDLEAEKTVLAIEEGSKIQDVKSEVDLPILTPISPEKASPVRLTKKKFSKKNKKKFQLS